ncbi:MAG: phosphinothricin acetyltransferase [candidate division Zixibacteria bacterium SM23_81]|nr:MAG: phosphinothricin acetyltransferase [candidate division Zixibacteria bacterium SM23_81]
MQFVVDRMTQQDWPAVQFIYREGIASGNATFEIELPDWEQWDKIHLPNCRLVARSDNQIVGWAALSLVSTRCVYAGVAEVSLYVKASERGKSIGKALLSALIEESEHRGIWTLDASIFPENVASIALHKSFGFREVGYKERIGQMGGVWRDVILMERRSKVTGI